VNRHVCAIVFLDFTRLWDYRFNACGNHGSLIEVCMVVCDIYMNLMQYYICISYRMEH
jgi:hypothetical protein